MGKRPSFQFYPMDWTRDLDEHPLEIEGAWIRICCKLFWSESRGEMTKTPSQWSRILRESVKRTVEILAYIETEKIGDIRFFDGGGDITQGITQNVTRNGLTYKNILKITVKSRRMRNEELDRQNNVLRQREYRARQKSNKQSNKKITPHSSFSSSSSRKDPAKTPDLSYQKNIDKHIESIKSQIAKIESLSKNTGKDFNVWAWAQYCINEKRHPLAILDSLKGLIRYWKTADDPWAYIEKIIKTKNQNFNEREHIKQSQKFKKLWISDPKIKKLIEGMSL